MMFGWGCRWIYEMDAAGMMPGSSTSSLSERSTQVCAASASKFFPAFLLAFFLSVYSPCNLVPGQLSTKEIKTTDVKSCKSNALKHEDEADHTSI
ncbi:unnamed protein product [Sphagnum jensenii]